MGDAEAPMKLACAWTAIMMSLPPAGPASAHSALSRQGADTPAPESRTPASVTGTKEERVAEAARSYDNGRFIEAALEFEGLFKDFPQELDFLFNAAISRHGAGHYAHTVAYTREYLARGTLGPDDRKEAEAQLTEASRRVVTVRVTVSAPASGPDDATIVAQHVARASADLRPELLFPVKLSAQPAAVSLELDPGAWTLRVEGPGYQRQERRIEVKQGTPGSQDFALSLAPMSQSKPDAQAPVREVPADVVRNLKLGFGVSGGVLMAAGIVLPAVGGAQVKRLWTDESKATTCKQMGMDDPEAKCRTDWRAPYRLRDSGLAVLGAGVGLLTGGLTWLIKEPRKRHKALLAETVIGGLAVGAGFTSLFWSSRPFNLLNTRDDWTTAYSAINGKVGGHAASMTLFGFGLGMLTSAAVGLGIQRKYAGSLRASALTGPGQAGVLLSGSF